MVAKKSLEWNQHLTKLQNFIWNRHLRTDRQTDTILLCQADFSRFAESSLPARTSMAQGLRPRNACVYVRIPLWAKIQRYKIFFTYHLMYIVVLLQTDLIKTQYKMSYLNELSIDWPYGIKLKSLIGWLKSFKIN